MKIASAILVFLTFANWAQAAPMNEVLTCSANGRKVSIKTDASGKIRLLMDIHEKIDGELSVLSHREATTELVGKITKIFSDQSSRYQVKTTQGIFNLQVRYEIDDNGAEQMSVEFVADSDGIDMAPYYSALGLPEYGAEVFYHKGECKGLMASRLDHNWH